MKTNYETIILNPSNEVEINLIKKILYTSKIKSKIINDQEKEDFALGLMMKETDYNETIDAAEFIKHLRGK